MLGKDEHFFKLKQQINTMNEQKQTTIQQLEQIKFLLGELTKSGSIESANNRLLLMEAELNIGEVLVHELSN